MMPLALALAFLGPAEERITLAWKLKPGDRFYVEEIRNARQTISWLGKETRRELTQTSIARYTVMSVHKNGDLTMEKKTERIKVSTGQPKSDTTALQALEGAIVEILITKQGAVHKIRGYDQFLTRLSMNDPATARLLRDAYSEDSIKASVASLFQCVPHQPVATKDRWRHSSRISLGRLGHIDARNTYTLLGEDDANKNLLKIGVLSELAYVLPAKDGDDGMTITGGLIRSDEATGTLWFDPRLGRLHHAESRQSLKGTLTASTSFGPRQMALEQHQVTKIRVFEHHPLETK